MSKPQIRFEWLDDTELWALAQDILTWEQIADAKWTDRMRKAYSVMGSIGPGTLTFVHGEVFREVCRRKVI